MFGREADEAALRSLEETSFDRTIPGDAVSRDFEAAPARIGPGSDGIPEFQELGQQHIVPLHPDTFICMADTTSYVLRDSAGVVRLEFEPKLARRTPDGRWWVDAEEVDQALVRRGMHPTDVDAVVRALSELVMAESEAWDREIRRRLRRAKITTTVAEGRVEVSPLRPKCEHYARYRVNLPGDTTHQTIERLCMAQRDDNGFLLSVSNQAVHSCEMRRPRHSQSEQQLDDFDEEKIRLGLERTQQQEEHFSVDEALVEETQDE